MCLEMMWIITATTKKNSTFFPRNVNCIVFLLTFEVSNKQKTTIMKVQAKDLNVGDVIRYQIISKATITEIEEFTQKNGKPCLSIKIKYGKENLCNHEFNMKLETKVDLRLR